MLASLRGAVSGLWPRVATQLAGGADEACAGVPDTRFNVGLSPKRHFDACWFALKDFKRIKERVGDATINDVVLAVCGGAASSLVRFWKGVRM